MSHAPTEAFIQQFTGCQARLFAYIAVLLGDAEAASDVLQETNLVLWRKSHEFVEGTDFNAWVSAVARFQVLAHLRDARRDRHHFDADVVEELAVVAENAVQDLDDRRTALRKCLETLNPGHRRLLQIRYLEERSVEETASASGRTVAGVVTTLGRLRRALLACIQRKLVREACR